MEIGKLEVGRENKVIGRMIWKEEANIVSNKADYVNLIDDLAI